jgi:hypothetical protein
MVDQVSCDQHIISDLKGALERFGSVSSAKISNRAVTYLVFPSSTRPSSENLLGDEDKNTTQLQSGLTFSNFSSA